MECNGKALMKLIHFNRRNFIKLIVGGAAGVHLTPLPWKLMDDIAIWTQNWPWLPIPPVGAFNHIDSLCQLCPGGCGIKVRKVDDRAVKIEGRTDYPVNPGGICPLGAGGLQLLYNEKNRFTGPMKRVGPRGSGKFMAISWDEALGTLADRIIQLRKKGSPEALAAIDGSAGRSSTSLLIQRLLQAVGSPNVVTIPSMEDTEAMVNGLMQGGNGPMTHDLENADFILSFGCGLIEGWGAPGRVINAWGLWHDGPPEKRTVKIVQIESRASNTASKADQWVAPRPGSETALALGLAHVIIKEGLTNKSFILNHTFGFSDWTQSDGKDRKGFKTLVLENYPPDAVAKMTGVRAETIISLAREFAKAGAPIALFGRGKGEFTGNLLESMAVQSLNALLGNINKPGGVLVQDPLPLSDWPEVNGDAIARQGLEKGRLDGAGSAMFPFSHSLIHNFAEAVLEADKAPVDTLLNFSANPAYTLPDGGAYRRALEKIPFIASFSPYRDETALMADLILPDHTYLEKSDDVIRPRGLPYPLYGMTQPVVEPLYDTKNCGDVIISLAGMLGKSVSAAFPWKDYEASLKERAKGLFEAGGGLTRYDASSPIWEGFADRKGVQSDCESFDQMWKNLKSGGLWYSPVHDFENWDRIFKTPTGKFEFCSSRLERALKDLAGKSPPESALKAMGIRVEGDEAIMPHYGGAPSSEKGGTASLLLMPYSIINLSSGPFPNPPYLNKGLLDTQLRKKESFVEINPETASKHQLQQGDRIIVQSPKGEVRVRVNLFEGAMPGVIYIPLGFGHRAYDDFQRGKGVNPNEIIDGGRDTISGQMVWWNTRVKIIKA